MSKGEIIIWNERLLLLHYLLYYNAWLSTIDLIASITWSNWPTNVDGCCLPVGT
jgi:hypothetical protein